jgi:YbbR domain-containing protein
MREWITKDLGWKLFSLFLAVVVWLTVHKIYEEPRQSAVAANDNTVTYGNQQVLVVSTAADVEDFRVAPNAVSVTVSGPPDVMAILQANKIRATVDLSDIQTNLDLKRRVEVSTPPGVTLVSVNPSRVGIIMPPPREK